MVNLWGRKKPKEEEPSAPVKSEPKPVECSLGFSAEKMRRNCGKCGGTQLELQSIYDGKKRVGLVYTCTDCKQKHQESKHG